MTTYTTGKVTITYNGVDLLAYLKSEEYLQYLNGEASLVIDTSPTYEFTITPEDWRKWTARPRVASRQSCLWRRSLDRHNRKRGHVGHRGTE